MADRSTSSPDEPDWLIKAGLVERIPDFDWTDTGLESSLVGSLVGSLEGSDVETDSWDTECSGAGDIGRILWAIDCD